MREPPSSPSLVVGIDGSRSALDAALWAVDEAVCRDIPLHLVYAIDPKACVGADTEDRARHLAAAEVALRYAFIVVESTNKPVKIEAEILQGRPTHVLLELSQHAAAMLCLGSVGLGHSRGDPIGSTAAALASAAQCPVAVVRGHDPARNGWVVAEIGQSPTTDGVLRHAFDEARLRRAALRVVTTWQSLYVDIHDNHAAADRKMLAKTRLDRYLAKWERMYPDVEMHAVAVHGNTQDYLSKNGDSIQLLVVGRERADGIRELVGPPGYAALHHANCSVLICEPQTVL